MRTARHLSAKSKVKPKQYLRPSTLCEDHWKHCLEHVPGKKSSIYNTVVVGWWKLIQCLIFSRLGIGNSVSFVLFHMILWFWNVRSLSQFFLFLLMEEHRFAFVGTLPSFKQILRVQVSFWISETRFGSWRFCLDGRVRQADRCYYFLKLRVLVDMYPTQSSCPSLRISWWRLEPADLHVRSTRPKVGDISQTQCVLIGCFRCHSPSTCTGHKTYLQPTFYEPTFSFISFTNISVFLLEPTLLAQDVLPFKTRAKASIEVWACVWACLWE